MIFIFFFQAEDGIRDKLVTGVQTCALPISEILVLARRAAPKEPRFLVAQDGQRGTQVALRVTGPVRALVGRGAPGSEAGRSEERRVGKGCRSRGSPKHGKKTEEQAVESRRL